MPTKLPLDSLFAHQLPASIRGTLLREFAFSTDRRRMSVIVTPCLPKVWKTRPALDVAAATRATSMLRKDLVRLKLSGKARSVSVFSGFVLEVTPRQLRLLAQASAVQSIRANLRRHQLLKN